jgi:hypothetical protein
MTKFITELLTEMNNDPKVAAKHKENASLQFLFEFAFNPARKFLLPETDPPYKKDAAPIGMSPANFHMEVKKFYIFTRKDLTQVRRESLFINLLESLHPSESVVLLAVKDQDLSRLYPKLTHKVLYDAGFVQSTPPPASVKKVSKAKNETAPTGAQV